MAPHAAVIFFQEWKNQEDSLQRVGILAWRVDHGALRKKTSLGTHRQIAEETGASPPVKVWRGRERGVNKTAISRMAGEGTAHPHFHTP